MNTQNVKIASSEHGWTRFAKSKSQLDRLLLVGLLGLAPMLYMQSLNLSSRKHLQFFPLAWVIFAVLIYLRGRPTPITASKSREIVGIGCVGAAVACAVVSIWLFSPWFAHVALVALCFGWMLLRLGENRWTTLGAWISLLAITLPLPLNGDSRLVQYLQNRATVSASALLDLMAVPHLVRGNILEIRTGDLFVDEACSGVDSLYSLLAVALMLAIWQERRFVESILTLLLVPFWAWLGNLLRIFLIAVMLDKFGIDWSHGWEHTVLGLALFTASFACLLTTQNSLSELLRRTQTSGGEDHKVAKIYNYLVNWPSKSEQGKAATSTRILQGYSLRVVFALGAMFAMVGVTSAFPLAKIGPWANFEYVLPSIPQDLVVSTFKRSDLENLDPQCSLVGFNVTHRDTGSVFGEHSATWELVDQGQPIQMSLDFPFPGFHDLTFCYFSTGYKRELSLSQRLASEAGLEVASAVLLDELNIESALLFINIDIHGNSVFPKSEIDHKIFGDGPASTAFQIQLFLPKSGRLSKTQVDRYLAMLDSANARLLPLIQRMLEEHSGIVSENAISK